MSLWTVTIAVVLIALLIPVLSVLRDAPRFRRTKLPEPAADPAATPAAEVLRQLEHRVQTLEDEIDELHRLLRDLRDDADVLRNLLQGSDRPER